MKSESGSSVPAAGSGASALRRLLEAPGIVVAPGVADGIGALLVKEAGFPAVYASGGAINRSRGIPDVGLTTLTQLCERIVEIVEACTLPVIVDADSGFGGILNVRSTVAALERAGAAALHLQDSELPRRAADPLANYFGVRDMSRRIEAACAACRDPSTVVIARTDVLDHLGFAEAIARARVYARAGAHVVYIEHMSTRDQIMRAAEEVRHPQLISLNKGLGELPGPEELARLGYKIVTHPADLQLSAIHAMRSVLRHLRETGTTENYAAMIGFPERDRILALAALRAVEQRYLEGESGPTEGDPPMTVSPG
jgi:2-methylisocitrate lyase-like PEP mutase family enzyme